MDVGECDGAGVRTCNLRRSLSRSTKSAGVGARVIFSSMLNSRLPPDVGLLDGCPEGALLGWHDGCPVGVLVGWLVGWHDGCPVGVVGASRLA